MIRNTTDPNKSWPFNLSTFPPARDRLNLIPKICVNTFYFDGPLQVETLRERHLQSPHLFRQKKKKIKSTRPLTMASEDGGA